MTPSSVQANGRSARATTCRNAPLTMASCSARPAGWKPRRATRPPPGHRRVCYLREYPKPPRSSTTTTMMMMIRRMLSAGLLSALVRLFRDASSRKRDQRPACVGCGRQMRRKRLMCGACSYMRSQGRSSDRGFVARAAETGLRTNGCAALGRREVDKEGRAVVVQRRFADGVLTPYPKTQRSRRRVPLSGRTLDDIESLPPRTVESIRARLDARSGVKWRQKLAMRCAANGGVPHGTTRSGRWSVPGSNR